MIHIKKITTHTPEWYLFRENGIGGSEQSKIHNLGFNDYDSAMVLWAQKCGYSDPERMDSEAMFHGRMHEDYILNLWQYYDGTDDGYMKNYASKTPVRTSYKVEGYLVNDEYPWLFASLDSVIKEGNVNLVTGEVMKKRGILEAKTLSENMKKAWDNGIPLPYIIQVHQYMLVAELDYAEIAVLQGGNKFYVLPIERNDNIITKIIDESKSFWYDRVLPARELVKEMKSGGNVEEIESRLLNFQPDPDSSDACRNYLRSRYRKEREKMVGTSELFDIALREKQVSKLIDENETEKKRLRNIILEELVRNKVEIIEFESGGYISYRKKDGAKNGTLNIYVK